MFIRAIWHMVKVVSAALFWLLAVMCLWGGVIEFMHSVGHRAVVLFFIVCLLIVRFTAVPRIMPASVFYVSGCVVSLVFISVLQARHYVL